MATDSEIEAEARAILRETLQQSGWYLSLHREERSKFIEQDALLHWRSIGMSR